MVMTMYDEKAAIIKEKVSVEDVIQAYAPRKIVRNRCRCPIHNGNNNNFKIYEDTQTYYCFVCHSRGDVVSLTMNLLGISYLDAKKKLDLDFFCGRYDKISNSQRIKLKQRFDAKERAWAKKQKEIEETYNTYHEIVRLYKATEDLRTKIEKDLKVNAVSYTDEEVGTSAYLLGRTFYFINELSELLDNREDKIAIMEGRLEPNG